MSFHDRQMRGTVSYYAGQAAEGCVARDYAADGYALIAERWRGKGGEVDLILKRGTTWVFVEVKAARDWATAAQRILPRQARRVQMAALEYLAAHCDEAYPDMRFDAALVDRQGRVDVIENAFM